MTEFPTNRHASIVQELQIPREMGWPIHPAISRITALIRTNGGRGAPGGRRSQHQPKIDRPEPVRAHHAGTRAYDDTAFEDWGNLVWKYGAGLGSEVSLNEFRKDIYLEFYNEAGQLVRAYKIYRCWPSEYQALPDLDANANAVAIEHIKLENEGWERDTSVVHPASALASRGSFNLGPFFLAQLQFGGCDVLFEVRDFGRAGNGSITGERCSSQPSESCATEAAWWAAIWPASAPRDCPPSATCRR